MKIKDKNLFTFCFFTIWFIVGVIYYSIKNELGWAKGFYMAISIGYSIGYGYPVEIDAETMVFSIFYLFFGRVIFIFAIYSLTEDFFQQSNSWYNQAKRKLLEEQSNIFLRIYMQMQDNFRTIVTLLIFAVIMIGFTGWSCNTFDINVTEGAYLALATLSSVGTYIIPEEVKY